MWAKAYAGWSCCVSSSGKEMLRVVNFRKAQLSRQGSDAAELRH
jgi:hypothetical protein